MLIIHTTTPTKKEAKLLINLLLESNLIACGQYFKITSRYVWQDSTSKQDLKNKQDYSGDKVYCKQKEYLLILKTIPEHYCAIESLLLSKHSYEVPEIVAFEAKAQAGYDLWLQDNLNYK